MPQTTDQAITEAVLKDMTLSQIAFIIRQNWKNVNFGAVPYLDALQTMDSIADNYGADPGSQMVAYFLSNATTWRGDTARVVKKELNRRLKAA